MMVSTHGSAASLALALAFVLGACGGDDGPSPATPDAPSPGTDGNTDCARPPAAADRTRFVVISHPYDDDAEASGVYEVLELSSAGALTRFSPPRTFEMDRTSFGTIAFTPDGELGFVATERGKVAIFRLDAAGNPTVITPGFQGSFYASDVVIAPAGNHAWIVDGNTAENGGGIYGLTIGCDGTPTDRGNLIPADFPNAFVLDESGRHAMIAARRVFTGSPAGHDVHRVLLDGDPPGLIAGADAFGDDDAIPGGAALTHDGGFFLVGDTSPVVQNRIAIVAVTDTAVTPSKILIPFPDPQGIVTSPFGDVAIATSTLDGDAIHVLDRRGPGDTWRDAGLVATQAPNPALPGDLTMIRRGSLAGRVFVSENVHVRQLAFRANGDVDDVGGVLFEADGLDGIVGAIGVTP